MNDYYRYEHLDPKFKWNLNEYGFVELYESLPYSYQYRVLIVNRYLYNNVKKFKDSLDELNFLRSMSYNIGLLPMVYEMDGRYYLKYYYE